MEVAIQIRKHLSQTLVSKRTSEEVLFELNFEGLSGIIRGKGLRKRGQQVHGPEIAFR